MKAILVIDEMPTRCLDCPLIWDEMNNDIVRCSNGRRLDDNDEYIYKQKPSWCPLRPLPSKLVPFGYLDAGNEDGLYEKGYNDCIDEITGETE